MTRTAHGGQDRSTDRAHRGDDDAGGDDDGGLAR